MTDFSYAICNNLGQDMNSHCLSITKCNSLNEQYQTKGSLRYMQSVKAQSLRFALYKITGHGRMYPLKVEVLMRI